jgi:hypothetical protein
MHSRSTQWANIAEEKRRELRVMAGETRPEYKSSAAPSQPLAFQAKYEKVLTADICPRTRKRLVLAWRTAACDQVVPGQMRRESAARAGIRTWSTAHCDIRSPGAGKRDFFLFKRSRRGSAHCRAKNNSCK